MDSIAEPVSEHPRCSESLLPRFVCLREPGHDGPHRDSLGVEWGGTARLHRMPADGSGKTGYYQPGGLLAALAESMEENMLRVAKADVERATALMTEDKVTKHELVLALNFLCHSARAAVDVAELRGERLDSTN